MSSVFKKLISSEFGEYKYNKYFYCYQKLIAEKKYDHKKLDNEEIYNDIYEQLKDTDVKALQKKMERLSDAMFLALRISKTYIFILLFFLAAAVFIIFQGLMVSITVVSLLLMSACFIYKTYEFVVNKYCFIDAHIIIVYKSVLDKLILKYDNRTNR